MTIPLIFTEFEFLNVSTLAYSMPLVFFHTPWKRQKTSGFLTFSEGIEKDQWYEMPQRPLKIFHWKNIGSIKYRPFRHAPATRCSECLLEPGSLLFAMKVSFLKILLVYNYCSFQKYFRIKVKDYYLLCLKLLKNPEQFLKVLKYKLRQCQKNLLQVSNKINATIIKVSDDQVENLLAKYFLQR